MQKITTLYKKDPSDLSRVTNAVDPANAWVFDKEFVTSTQKFDGSACMIKDSVLYKRYDVKKGRQIPADGIPCQEPDEITGHQPFWIKCDRAKPEDRYFWEGFDSLDKKEEGTYELCGERIEKNPEKIKGHQLLKHGSKIINISDFSYDNLRSFLAYPANNIEGIVFHHKDGRMCKIRKSDFGFNR